jgi:hypothetical protein
MKNTGFGVVAVSENFVNQICAIRKVVTSSTHGLGHPRWRLGHPRWHLGHPRGRLGTPRGRLGHPRGHLGHPRGGLSDPCEGCLSLIKTKSLKLGPFSLSFQALSRPHQIFENPW